MSFLSVVRRNPNMGLGIVILVCAATLAIFAPLISRYDPVEIHVLDRLQAPSTHYWFGTDNIGRDIFSRSVYGSRISLTVGASVVVIVVIVGEVLGTAAGYSRPVDDVLMRFVDGIMAFPSLLLALVLMAMLGPSLANVIIAISVGSTPAMVRVVRSTVLSLRERPFVDAARAQGSSTLRIIAVHIIPNTVGPVTVQASFLFAVAMLIEAGLSFIGAGIPPYIPSWGNIISLGRNYLQVAPWIILFPGIFLTITVLAANLVGDGIRDIVDPHLRGRL